MSALLTVAPFTERRDDGYTITTDRDRIDADRVFAFLVEEAYWAADLTRPVFDRAMAASVPIVALAPNGALAAYARVVTDLAVFAYVRDVFTLTEHRGRGLAAWLCLALRRHPDLVTITTWMLATRDAHAVYAKAGYRPVDTPDWYMRVPPDLVHP